MSDRAQSREEAIRLIVSAFSKVTRDGGVSLHEAQVIDDYGSESQRRKARARDTEKRWTDVPDKDIEDHYSVLSFLDPIGYRYYLPAYMVWALRHHEHSQSLSVDHTIYSLNPSTNEKIRSWQMERFSQISITQAKAIVGFLKYMAEHSDGRADDGAANEALHDHWGKLAEADS